MIFLQLAPLLIWLPLALAIAISQKLRDGIICGIDTALNNPTYRVFEASSALLTFLFLGELILEFFQELSFPAYVSQFLNFFSLPSIAMIAGPVLAFGPLRSFPKEELADARMGRELVIRYTLALVLLMILINSAIVMTIIQKTYQDGWAGLFADLSLSATHRSWLEGAVGSLSVLQVYGIAVCVPTVILGAAAASLLAPVQGQKLASDSDFDLTEKFTVTGLSVLSQPYSGAAAILVGIPRSLITRFVRASPGQKKPEGSNAAPGGVWLFFVLLANGVSAAVLVEKMSPTIFSLPDWHLAFYPLICIFIAAALLTLDRQIQKNFSCRAVSMAAILGATVPIGLALKWPLELTILFLCILFSVFFIWESATRAHVLEKRLIREIRQGTNYNLSEYLSSLSVHMFLTRIVLMIALLLSFVYASVFGFDRVFSFADSEVTSSVERFQSIDSGTLAPPAMSEFLEEVQFVKQSVTRNMQFATLLPISLGAIILLFAMGHYRAFSNLYVCSHVHKWGRHLVERHSEDFKKEIFEKTGFRGWLTGMRWPAVSLDRLLTLITLVGITTYAIVHAFIEIPDASDRVFDRYCVLIQGDMDLNVKFCE